MTQTLNPQTQTQPTQTQPVFSHYRELVLEDTGRETLRRIECGARTELIYTIYPLIERGFGNYEYTAIKCDKKRHVTELWIVRYAWNGTGAELVKVLNRDYSERLRSVKTREEFEKLYQELEEEEEEV